MPDSILHDLEAPVALPAPAREEESGGLESSARWRERFLMIILRSSFLFGLVVALPSVLVGVRDERWVILGADALGLGLVFLLWRSPSWPYRVRAGCLVALLYLLGMFFLLRVGPVGQVYLMAFPLMASLLLGRRPAVFALVLNAVSMLLGGYYAGVELRLPGFESLPLLKWAVITLNLTFVTSMITVASAMLMRRLERSLEHQHAITLSLQAERERLNAANAELLTQTVVRRHAEAEVRNLNAVLEHRVSQRTGQLQAANKELEAFSYSVSHDLRAPLSSIQGFSHILEKSLGGTVNERTRHALDSIRTNTRYMGELIEALLSLAQLSRASVRWDTVDLAQIARDTFAARCEAEPARSVQFTVHSGLQVQGDPGLLAVVLDNLIGNAWKFTARRADAKIEIGRGERPDGAAFYYVRDNGAGFDMAHSGKLFGAFQRLHSPGEFTGSGIGLATVKRIVERHGGSVWAESAVGEGATFYFNLGAAAASA